MVTPQHQEPTIEAADEAATARAALVATLRERGKITSAGVEAAFRRVPRELFMPLGTPLAEVYGFDSSVVTARDPQGVPVSSVSAAYIQAVMLEQAELRPGARVLEIGSGGLNAALIAEVVGRSGAVVTIDIDPEVTARATATLDAAGYGGRVRVVTADADRGLAGDTGGFDAIIVTVGAWDIPPAWLAQLRPGGTLVLPLIMNGVTRTVGLHSDGDHLTSRSAEVAGFVPMRGDGAHPDRVFDLPEPGAGRGAAGGVVRVVFDAPPPDMTRLDGVLATGRHDVWSGVTIGRGVSFADLHLWFACHLPGFCRLSADPATRLAAERGSWFPFATVHGSGLAFLAVRPVAGGVAVEFGARGHGPADDAVVAASAMVDEIRAWHHRGRDTEPVIGYWPTGSDRSRIPADAAVVPKSHGVVAVRWPAHT